MNCKPGQLAIVNSGRYYVGAVIKVVRLVGGYSVPHWESEEFYPVPGNQNLPVYWSDRTLQPIDGGETPEQSLEAMRLLTQIPKEEKVC